MATLNNDAVEEMKTPDGGSENDRIAFRNRPIDVVSFLSRDELTINDGLAEINTHSSMKEGVQEIELPVIGKEDTIDKEDVLILQQKLSAALIENKRKDEIIAKFREQKQTDYDIVYDDEKTANDGSGNAKMDRIIAKFKQQMTEQATSDKMNTKQDQEKQNIETEPNSSNKTSQTSFCE